VQVGSQPKSCGTPSSSKHFLLFHSGEDEEEVQPRNRPKRFNEKGATMVLRGKQAMVSPPRECVTDLSYGLIHTRHFKN